MPLLRVKRHIATISLDQAEAYEDLTFEVLKRLTGHDSGDPGALPERRNRLIFRFLAELEFESSTNRALHPGFPVGLIVDRYSHGWLAGNCGREESDWIGADIH